MNAYASQIDLLKALSHSTRLAILDVLRDGEQCVCHREATLGLRQAYISQPLMILKQAGLLESRRDGLNLYCRVIQPEVFNVLDALVSEAVAGSGRTDVLVERVDDERTIRQRIPLEAIPGLLIDGQLVSEQQVPDLETLLDCLRSVPA